MGLIMRVPVLLADYPTGSLTGMVIIVGTLGAVLLCLFVASAMSLAESRRVVRSWLFAAGVCVVACVIALIVVRFLGLP